MARSEPGGSFERTGRHDSLAALAAGTAVAALAGAIFLAAGDARERTSNRQPDTITVDDRRPPRVVELEAVTDPRWGEFVAELARRVPEATARAAGEQACLALQGNAGEGAAVDAVIEAGVPADEAVAVVDASRRLLCP